MSTPSEVESAIIEYSSPKCFKMDEVIILNVLGNIVGLVPIMIIGMGGAVSMGLVSMLNTAKRGMLLFPMLLGSLLLGIAAMGLVLYFIPSLGNGNWLIKRILRTALNQPDEISACFIFQLSTKPRRYTGMRGLLEDADDIGYLCLTDKALVYKGDSINMLVPYKSIRSIRYLSCGWRVLWLCGEKIEITFPVNNSLTTIVLGERASRSVTESKRIIKKTCESLSAKVKET
jgi:hypothetical protein